MIILRTAAVSSRGVRLVAASALSVLTLAALAGASPGGAATRAQQCYGPYMPSCNVYYVIQRAPASNRPGSNAPSLNGTLGFTWANPNSFGDGCTTSKPDESVVGSNAGAGWNVGSVNGLNFDYDVGKKRGADTVTFGVTLSECAAHPDWS